MNIFQQKKITAHPRIRWFHLVDSCIGVKSRGTQCRVGKKNPTSLTVFAAVGCDGKTQDQKMRIDGGVLELFINAYHHKSTEKTSENI